ncbi:MAG: hypothetical protein WD810_04735 [Solirubrobacterales bacterium]
MLQVVDVGKLKLRAYRGVAPAGTIDEVERCGDDDFFAATKAMHNALQGAERGLTELERDAYLASARRNAELLGFPARVPGQLRRGDLHDAGVRPP